MKTVSVVITILLIAQNLFSIEPGMLNMHVPSHLKNTESVFMIHHRFYGKITEDPLRTFFGMDVGANIGIGLRYALLPRLELKTSYTRYQKEYTIGTSYAHYFPALSLRSQIGLQFFSYELSGIEDRRQNIFFDISLQSERIFKKLIPVVNIGFDAYNERIGFGAGGELDFDTNIGPVKKTSILGEYFPVTERDTTITGSHNSFAVGLKLETYGHHFVLLVGNNSQIGTRRLMLGADNNDLFFGFNVHRFFDL
jgi:hypothetical protein